MPVWIGCMPNHNLMEHGMSNLKLNDFVSNKERLNHPSKFINHSKFNFYDLIAVIFIVIAIGGQSWL